MRAAALGMLLLVASAGCLRVGPGEDLHLVCEEKSGSPRMPYGVDFLYARTRVDDGVPSDAARLSMLDLLRHHVVTLGGREYPFFQASLTTLRTNDSERVAWLFDAVGGFEDDVDTYRIHVHEANGSYTALSDPPVVPVSAPRHLRDIAWRAANATPEVTAKLGNGTRVIEWASWDPALPSCVTLRIGSSLPGVHATVNVVQSRVVHIAVPG